MYPDLLGRSDAGVTTIQALITLMIVGVLVYVAVPVWGQLVVRSRAASCQVNQRNIYVAVSMAREDGKAGRMVGYFDSVLERGSSWGAVLLPAYMEVAPRCSDSESGGALYNLSPLGQIWSDRGAGQYTWVNQGAANDHRLRQ